ncbi:MAG: hypothetical protein KC620_18165, partial [Myxococcales bacterium]|nr:hypothetical protein [Myxococcales bacterium]
MSLRALILAACALALTACGNQPKPAELVSFEQMRQGEIAATVQDREPELYAEAEKAYKRALAAYEDDEPDDTLHATRLATIIWRTAVARSQLRDFEDAVKAEKRRVGLADEQLADAERRKQLATDAIARQERIIDMQQRLAAAEAQSRQVKRAADAKAQVDAAALKLKEAETLEAARLAPGEFNKAQAALRMAFDQFTAGNYKESEKTAALVIADADAAIVAARPL